MKLQKRNLRLAALAAMIALSAAALSPLSASALSFVNTVPVGQNPVALALSADDATLFVSNGGDGTITLLDVTNAAAAVEADVYDLDQLTGETTQPGALLLSSTGATLYVADTSNDMVYQLNVSDLAAPVLDWSAPVAGAPTALALSDDNLQLVVTTNDASISVFTILGDLSGASVSGPFYIPGAPADLNLQALSPTYGFDGSQSFLVADGFDSLWGFDATDFSAPPEQLVVGGFPTSIFLDGRTGGMLVAGRTSLTAVFPDLSTDVISTSAEAGVWSVALAPDFNHIALTNTTDGYVNFGRISGPPFDQWTETLASGATTGVIFSSDSQTAYSAQSGSDTVSIMGLTGEKVEPTPGGTLLATNDISLPLAPPFMTLPREDDPDEGDQWLAGRSDGCGLEVGAHPYETLPVTVTQAGTYTFRIIGTSPNSLDEAPDFIDTPISDPFLAVYSTFDPASPDDGVVGCNDDRGKPGDSRARIDAVNSTIYDENWSYLSTTLEPGSYVLVLTTYDTYRADEWVETDPEVREWDAQVLTASYEVWGPSGGLTAVGADASGALAKTGSDTASWSLATAALTLLAGLAALLVTRRRRRDLVSVAVCPS
jgi:LPXTG-motif cell wall-anchored protein